MPMSTGIPIEIIMDIKARLDSGNMSKSEKRALLDETARTFSVHSSTIYRQIRNLGRLRAVQRKDKGSPRVLSDSELRRFCELVAAIKMRTENKKGRHASTRTAIHILESTGIEVNGVIVKAPPGILKRPTVNRYLRSMGISDKDLAREDLITRFEATYSNAVWQFDLSVSDLKSLDGPIPEWARDSPKKQLMIYSVVDDKSGVCYQEYHAVTGEDVIAAFKFLFNAMSPKSHESMPFQGIPDIVYMDNGPIAKSHLFQRVMKSLGVEIRCHYPRGKGGNKTACRAKGKVERLFRTVKEVHEIMYKFHKPKSEDEINSWLLSYLVHYNNQGHRREDCSRIESWAKNLPEHGYRQMCSWEKFTHLAREPQQRKVGNDLRLTFDGLEYIVNPELAGQDVKVLVGVFDNDIFIEHAGEKYGPYGPSIGVIPFNAFRTAKQTEGEKSRRRIEKLSEAIALPKNAMDGGLYKVPPVEKSLLQSIPSRPFEDKDPFEELRFSSELSARKFISKTIGKPLGVLSKELSDQVDQLLQDTLERAKIQAAVNRIFKQSGELRS
jgi:hypothetical protein